MPERQVARPKPPSSEAASAAETAGGMPGQGSPALEAPPSREDARPLDFTDSQFDDQAGGAADYMAIEVEHDLDPVRADIEQAAVLFANGQDSAARSVLEMAARSHTGEAAERLWRMLLDLVQILGDRATFDKLGMEFAQACETSPPTWRLPEKAATPAGNGAVTLSLQGVIAGAEAPELSKLKAGLAAKTPLRIDLARLAGCDDAAAGELCSLLRLARKQGVSITLDGADSLVARLDSRLQAGKRESAAAWLLVLELYQRLDRPEAFEEKAVDYAVTFEVSPPSWETVKAAGGRPAAEAKPAEPALILTGELKNYRFDELPNYVESTDQPVLDFSRVKRMDFFSAGLLRNTLEPFRRRGKEVVIRHPHHLVAELMGIVGLNNVARIIVPKS